MAGIDKPTKPTNLMPRNFGGIKNEFDEGLVQSGFEPNIPQTYNGDNLNYQLDATGQELDYVEKVVDYVNATPALKTPIVNIDGKLDYTQVGVKVYDVNELYYLGEWVRHEGNLYESLKNDNKGYALNDTTVWKVLEIGNAQRKIGQLVSSLIPLNDAGLHLLDGATLSGEGMYAAFVTYMGSLYASGLYPKLFYTETQYNNSINTYGTCGKFIYDNENNTVRLPKITGILEGVIDENALGNLIEAGLPSITNHTHTFSGTTSSAGVHSHSVPYTATNADNGGSSGTYIIADDSGSLRTQWLVADNNGAHTHTYSGTTSANGAVDSGLYGKSTTVQPQTTQVFYYIVVGTMTKTEIEVDIDNISADLAGKADTALGNLTPSAQPVLTANFDDNLSKKITNCILEAPHMVDLELADGVLTLKAGSKVIVPYGTSAPELAIGDSLNGGTIVDISWDNEKLFYVVETLSDITSTTVGNASGETIYITLNKQGTELSTSFTTHSGTSYQFTTPYDYFYNTAENIVRVYGQSSSNITDYVSLPFAVALKNNTGYVAVTQVFQSIGYIGSTVWAMKGIKGLIPNGRNEDETLNNEEYTTSYITTATLPTNYTYSGVSIALNTLGDISFQYLTYDETNNRILNQGQAVSGLYVIGHASFANGIPTSFTPKYPFQAVDANDTEFIARQAMPSSKYIDLTLGASTAQYTAPADGYVCFRRIGATQMQNRTVGFLELNWSSIAPTSQLWGGFLPVKKNDVFDISYSGTDTSYQKFRFFYAQGAQ